MRSGVLEFLQNLRAEIIHEFEKLESSHKFQKTVWSHHTGGGGEMAVLRGQVFEKTAVNWSGVSGDVFPLSEAKGPYFATGVSLITHMSNPHAPTVHMNIRYIETADRHWFGGGYDLTPMGFVYEEDKDHFHNSARKALEPFGVYAEFAQNAREYFYIPHRKKERGVGGIFFDHLNSGDFERDFTLWQAVGGSFLGAILPIYHRRISQSFSGSEREKQLEMRAHYAEFNLLYDRGTKFGFQSGGNPEAILCSMPPLLKW